LKAHRLCQSSTGKYDPLQRPPRFGEGLEAPSKLADWWRSSGSVFTDSPQGSIHIKRLEGVIFESQQAAEAHGLELCKKWIDKNLKSIDDV